MTETQVSSFLGRLADQIVDEFTVDQLLDQQVKLIAKSWSTASDDDLTTLIEVGIALVRLQHDETDATREMRSLFKRLNVKCA